MNPFAGFLFVLVFFGGVLGIVLLASKIYEAVQERKKEKWNLKNAIKAANTLFKCDTCSKYSRAYQQIIKYYDSKLKGALTKTERFCPHCEAHRYNLHRSYDEYSWLETHPDCPEIDKKGYLIYKDTLAKLKQSIEDIEEIKAFQKYNGFE